MQESTIHDRIHAAAGVEATDDGGPDSIPAIVLAVIATLALIFYGRW